MSHATIFLILDAGRSDYIDPARMPFLDGLSQQSLTCRFESPPGFAQRTTFFTGRYPDTSGNFSAYAFDPENSPFAWVENLDPASRILKPRKIMWPGRWAIDKMTGWLNDAHHTDPAWIPPRILPYFRPCEDEQPVDEPGALGAPSIFDACRNHGLNYRYLAHPISGDDEAVTREIVRELRAGASHELYVAQLSALDEQGHTHGPDSRVMDERVLPTVDSRIASVHAALEANLDTWDLFVCGDHGMAPVDQRVDVLAHLDQADAEPGEDYVAFVNSTLVVLWYLTPTGRQEIEPLLDAIPGTHTLDEEDRANHRIPTSERWGHRMLAAGPGVLFWPDYFHVTDSTVRGMHGYLDKSTEGYGACVLASNRDRVPTRSLQHRSLVDVFPTLCDLLDVPIPQTQEGSSLLTANTDGSKPGPNRRQGGWVNLPTSTL